MASELAPPPEPTVAQLFALVMEEREVARANCKATLDVPQHLVQLSAVNVENNATLLAEHQRLSICEHCKRKMMTPEETSIPRYHGTSPVRSPLSREPMYARPTPKHLRGCFTCGEEGHFARECPKKDPALAHSKVTKKTQVPT